MVIMLESAFFLGLLYIEKIHSQEEPGCRVWSGTNSCSVFITCVDFGR